MVFGISDDERIVGLSDAESDSEVISECVKTKLDPVPDIRLEFKEIDGKKLILLHVNSGTETPYYYIGGKQRLAFIRNNSHKRWWKESDHREELPDYPERAVTEVICNAIIHRDYQELGSEIHIDIYDDRMEVYSPGGMIDGRLIQQLNPLSVPSKRRNPLLADFFSRLDLMERRGSGMKKILGEYVRFESLKEYHAPEFTSNASEFHVTLWNLNYGTDVVKDAANDTADVTKEFVKGFVKEPPQFTKEFVKAQRRIYKLISTNPQINITAIAENLGVSTRQVQKYLRRLTELQLIAREGGRKNGIWKILDKDYDDFFERI